jgi:hypothetical protein
VSNSANWKKQKIQLRRGTAAEWVTRNTLLLPGEVGYETDTGRQKIGDGVTRWNQLPYWAAGGVLPEDSRLTDSREWSAETITQADAESGTSTDRRAFTAQRVFQAIAAWWAGTADKAKLDGIATGATANSSDAHLLARQNHTGTQAISTVTDLQDALTAKAPLASPTFTGTVSGITKTMVGLGNVDNTSDAAKPISTATQTALNAKAPINNPTFTGTVSGVTKSMVGLGNVDNTSDLNKPISTATQTALDGKQASGTYATLVGGKVPGEQLPGFVDDVLEYTNVGDLPATGTSGTLYVVTSENKVYRWSGTQYIEIVGSPGTTDAVPEGSTNLYYTDARASAAAPVQSVAGRSGAVVLAKADVGLSNVDNTSDANKPVSTATQTALDGKVGTSDARLSDARTPTAHTHLFSEISDITFPSPLTDNSIVRYTAGVGWGVANAIGTIGVGSQPLGGWPAGSVGASLAGKASTAHKSSHATGGSDALTPSDIGAAPAASPAITGAATFVNTGNVVPLTVTNTGTGNSFVVNDASGDTTPFVVDAAGKIGVGISTPNSTVHVVHTSSAPLRFVRTGFSDYGYLQSASVWGLYDFTNSRYRWRTINDNVILAESVGNVGIQTTSPASTLHVNGVITVSATAGSAGSYLPSVCFASDANTGLGQVGGADTVSLITAGKEAVRIDSVQRVRVQETTTDGTGVTRIEWMNHNSTSAGFGIRYGDSYASGTAFSAGTGSFVVGNTGGQFAIGTTTAHATRIGTNGLTRILVDSSGRVGIGTTTPLSSLSVISGLNTVGARVGTATTTDIHRFTISATGSAFYQMKDDSNAITVVIAAAGNTYFNGGNVGIGTITPNNRLSVVGQFSAGNVERIPNNSGAAGFYDRVEIGGGTQATKSYGSLWIYNSSNSQTHQFHSFAGTDNYINNGGKLGVNTASPASTLHVNGVITVSATAGSAGSYLPSLTFSGDPNTGFGQVSGQSDTASVFTAGIERVRVKADGTLHIGSNYRTNVGVNFEHALPNTVSQIGCLFSQYIGSAATTAYAQYIRPYLPQTGTISDVIFSACVSEPKPAGVQVTRSTGYYVSSSIAVGSANNYAYRGLIAASAGGGNFNCYMDGTAPNFFAGKVGIGASRTSPASALDVNGVITVSAGTAAAPAIVSVRGRATRECSSPPRTPWPYQPQAASGCG